MKILVTGHLPDEVMARLRDHEVEANEEDRPWARERLLRGAEGKEGLLCMITDKIDEQLLDRAPQLKMIANCGVGFDNIDLSKASERGIPVSNTPDVLTDATADLTFALILAIARRLVEGDRQTREGRFRFWAPLHFLGREVSGKTLGIIGLGRIGKAVARRARGFDMKVLYHNRERIAPGEEKRLGVSYLDRDRLLEQSDFVSLHVPLTEESRHMIGQEALKRMKRTCFLINTSRGPVVDEEALCDALRRNDIAGAGLDVYENEPNLTPGLKDLNNVILLPHAGSATIETRTRMAMLAATNLLAGLAGQRPPNCLNWEAVSGNR